MEKLILIVDDARFARIIAKKALQNGGYDQIVEAATAAAALEIFQEKKPDLTLLDITLPDNTDLTLLKKLLTIDPKASIVIHSAIGQELIIMDALKAGAKDFIVKPFNQERIVETVKTILGQ